MDESVKEIVIVYNERYSNSNNIGLILVDRKWLTV
jgi:hypothetical protein